MQKQKKVMKNVRFFLTFFFINRYVSTRCSKHKIAETNADIHIFFNMANFFKKNEKNLQIRKIVVSLQSKQYQNNITKTSLIY